MKHSLLLGLCLASSVASANCLVRTDIKVARQQITSPATDVQRMVTPDPQGQKCVLQYRINIDNEWRTAEGVGHGATANQACDQALNAGQGTLLAEVEPNQVSANTDMVCSDMETIRVHRVRIGDIIWESEVDIHSHPQERRYFSYKRTQCRMFVERDNQNKNLYINQGVICRLDSTHGSRWSVVDKY